QTIAGYLKGEIKLIVISAAIVYAGLLVLQMDHALTITVLAAFIDLFPFIGTGMLFIPWILYMFMTADYRMTIGLCVLYIIVVIQRQLLEPKIRSTSVGLHPLTALFVLFVCLQVSGVFGLFISPIVLILIGTLYKTGVLK